MAPVVPRLCSTVRAPPPPSALGNSTHACFCRRYKSDLTEEQKQALLDVLRVKVHAQITPEIRREIVHSVARGEEIAAADGTMEVEVL